MAIDSVAAVATTAPLSTKMAQTVSASGVGKTAAPTSGAAFVDSLEAALQSVSRSQLDAGELQRQFQLENPAVSLEDTMISMNKASINFAAAVQVRNRLVQAYDQIMNMPV